MFDLRDVVQNYGYVAGYIVMALHGIFVGIIGYILAERERKIGMNSNGMSLFLGFVFSFILAFLWMRSIGYPLVSWYSHSGEDLAWNLGFMIGLVIVASFIATMGCLEEFKGAFFTKEVSRKMAVSAFMVVPTAFFLAIMEKPVYLFNANNEQKANYIAERIVNESTSEEIKKFLYSKDSSVVDPFYIAVGNLRIGNHEEGAKMLARLAVGKNKSEQDKLLGFSAFYEGNYEVAYKYFNAASSNDLAITSLYLGGKLDREMFNILAAKTDPTDLIQEFKRTLPIEKKEDAVPIEKKENAAPKDKLDILLQRMAALEESMKENKVDKEKIEAAELKIKERINGQAGQFVFSKLLAFQKIPPSNFNADRSFWINYAFLNSSWILFIICMFSANALLRDHWQHISTGNGRMSKILSVVTQKANHLSSRLSRQSFIAKKISAKIALMEKEKGMFSEEINRIRGTVFPIDIFLSTFYLWRVKKILQKWELNSQEKEDVKLIYQAIKSLSGKLIPQGNEETLAIIMGLRKKSVAISDKFLKQKLSYEKSRTSLLETLEELATIGDIIGARKEDHLSYYSLLGINPEADSETIKKAYRSVITAVHPDKHQGNSYLKELTVAVNAAYATLSNLTRREVYNRQTGF